MIGKTFVAGLLALTAAAVITTFWLTAATRKPEPPVVIDLTGLLAGDDEGFARPDPSWRFSFPDDFAAHPDFRTESWYFAGYLVTPQSRRFGFQLGFFRVALAPEPPSIESAWATHQVYRAHLAVADVAAERFHAFERFSRAALELSGSTPARVWLENWSAAVSAEADQIPRFRLQAVEDELKLDLQLESLKSVVLPGNGLIGNAAFHSFLFPRLAARGMIEIGEKRFAVEGLAWLDRVWGAVLSPRGQIAFNRFFLQLNDGREIIVLQIHRRDGSRDPIDRGLVINSDGSFYSLDRREVVVEALDDWQSPRDGSRYPARWRLRAPAHRIDLEIAPLLSDQEMNFSVRYWGGAVRVAGTIDDQPVSGSGGVELTGYGSY